MSESSLDVDSEFIEENKILNSKKVRNGGPYTKAERDKRLLEVSRLHFEYGYSARKIADLMKINRNTVNSDLDVLYLRVFKNNDTSNPEIVIIINLERLDTQRTRLREQLDKAKSFQEKLALERLIYEIDCKILSIHMHVTESVRRMSDYHTRRLNEFMKENKKDERYMSLYDKIRLSPNAFEKVTKIINQDREKPRRY